MSKLKKTMLTSSKETATGLAKKAIKNGNLIEDEGSFPIYVVVSSHDKNDDILIIHPRNSDYNLSAKNSTVEGEDNTDC